MWSECATVCTGTSKILTSWAPFPAHEPQDTHILTGYKTLWASLVAQMVKKPPAMQEAWQEPRVQSLGEEDPTPWRRKWQSTPVFLPGEFHGWRSLVGYCPRSHKKSDATKWHTHTHTHTSFQGRNKLIYGKYNPKAFLNIKTIFTISIKYIYFTNPLT